jgi:hypothetical protein
MSWGFRLGLVACIGLLSTITAPLASAQTEVKIYEETFDNLNNITTRLLGHPVYSQYPLIQNFQTWSLSNNPGPGRQSRGIKKTVPITFSQHDGTYFMGATYYGVGYVTTPYFDISGHSNVRIRLKMAAAQEGRIIHHDDDRQLAIDQQNHFEATEYVRLYINGRVLDIFEGGNPLKLPLRFPNSSALTSVRTREVINTNFTFHEYDLSSFIQQNNLNPKALQLYIIAKTTNEYVGFDTIQVVAPGTGSDDSCPNDPNKTEPGICGCGVSDVDSDGDGTPDCNDGCSSSSFKIASGVCGCAIPETDMDGDGTPDCIDGCPSDANKTSAGTCGCGVSDVLNACGTCGEAPDSDGDGIPDCTDQCPSHPGGKNACNTCGVAADADSDGTPDCIDDCPNHAGGENACGQCGEAPDSDGDGTPDCVDQCDSDPAKTEPGTCGCGVEETENCGEEATRECFIVADAIGPDPTLTTGRGGVAADVGSGGGISGIPGLEITADGVSVLKELQMVVFTREAFDYVTDFTTYNWRIRIWKRDAFFTQPRPISSSPDMMEFPVEMIGNVVCAGANGERPCVPEQKWGLDPNGKDAWLVRFDLSSIPELQSPLPAGQYVVGAYNWLTDETAGIVFVQTSKGDGPLATWLSGFTYVTPEDPVFNDYYFIPADLNNWAMTLTEMVPQSHTSGRTCK